MHKIYYGTLNCKYYAMINLIGFPCLLLHQHKPILISVNVHSPSKLYSSLILLYANHQTGREGGEKVPSEVH